MRLKKILSLLLAMTMLFSCVGLTAMAEEVNVAKVGNTEYATIDEAIANWTNGTTLTLLADVTLSDVITLKSTEHHILDLGTYTMTAASGKNAIEITCEGLSNATYALTVNADATNPGGITATGKACIYYKKTVSTKDRPIIVINGGVYNGSYSINSVSNGNTNCPQFRLYGGTFNGNVNLTKNMLWVSGGTFNGWVNCTGDSSAYRQISGGTFKQWQFMTADADNKFWVGTSKANYDVGVYVDDNGYLVVGGPVVAEPGETFEASSANYGGWSSYLKYSSAKNNGLYYTSVEEAFADNNKTTGSVTVYVDELDMTGINYKGTIVVPEGEEITIVVAEGVTPAWTVKSAVENEEPNVTYEDTNGNELVKNESGAFVESVPAGPAWDGEGTSEAPYLIEDVAGLKAFQASINSGEVSGEVYFKLAKDIDLATDAVSLFSEGVTPNWEPIGTKENPFTGTFDGDGKTISNLIVVGEANQGFIGYADTATIKNINIENTTVIGTDCVGAIAGQVYSSSVIDNCHVTGNIQITGQTNVGGIVGKYYTKVTNSSVIGDEPSTSFVKGVYYASNLEGDNVGGIMGHGGENNNFVGNTVKNITVSGTRKIGGIVGTTDRATDVSGCVVENVILETTATVDYATNKADTMALGGLIGHYYGNSTGGTVNDSTVEGICFVKENDVPVHAGAIVGNNRTTPNDPVEGVNFEDNTVTSVIGATNNYLQPTVTYIAQTMDADGNVVGSYSNFESAIAAATADAKITRIEILSDYEQTTVANTDDYNYINKALTIGAPEGENYTITINVTGDSIALCVNDGGSLTIEENVTIEGLDVVANGFATTGENMTINGTLKALSLKQWTNNGAIIINETGSVWLGYGDGQFDLAYGNGTVIVNGNGNKTTAQFKAGYSGTRGNGNTMTLNDTYFEAGAWFTVAGSNGTINVDNSVLAVSGGDALGTLTMSSAGNAINLTNGSKLQVGNLTIGENNSVSLGAGCSIEAATINGTGKIVIDAANMTAGTTATISGNASGFTGTIEVINNDYLEANIDENGNIVLTEVVKAYVAEVKGTEYTTFAAAAAAATAGDTITILADTETFSGTITLPAGVTLNGNGKTINGEVWAGGNLTFVGHTKVTNFNAGYNKPTITIGEGACLELTGSGRMVIGHGATFNITGTITDAKTANTADLTPSLIIPGASFTGDSVDFNVTNAYIKATAYCSSSKTASGTFDFDINNSVWEQTNKLAFEAQSTNATVNFDLKDSVLTTTSHLVFGVDKGEIVIDNSNVNVGTSRQLENRSTMTIKNGSVVNGAVATSSNAKNPGTITVDNATYAVTGEFSGSDLGTGTLIVKKGATVSVGSIVDKAKIFIDATGMTAETAINFTGNLSKFVGTVEVINNNSLEANIVDGKIVLVEKAIAQIGETTYTDIQTALKALKSGDTLTLLADVTISDKWDSRYTGGKITVPVTIDGNGHTMTFTDVVYDGGNHMSVFRFESDATVKNLTIDMSEALSGWGTRFRAISAKGDLTVDNCKFIGNGSENNTRAIIFGESASDLKETDIVVTNSEFIGWRNGVIDNEGGKIEVKNVTIEGNKFTNANVNVSASNSVAFNNNRMDNSWVIITTYATTPELNVVAKENTLCENGTTSTTMNKLNNFATKDVQEGFWFPVENVAEVNGVGFATLQEALDAAVAGTGNITVEILDDIDLTDVDWNPVTVSGPGYPVVTVNGNGKTITGLKDMLFAGTWAGGSGLIINDLTIKDSTIENDVDDTTEKTGVGAFIGFPQASSTITLKNCHLIDSKVEGGHWTGGLIGYAAGYAGNDGPVFMNLTITGCSVTGSTVTGKGSAGGVIGHGSGNGWTNVVIENTTVSNNTITSTGSSTNKAGALMGTIGAAGQSTTVNGVTKTGGASVSATVSGNIVKSNGTPITTIYGRQGTNTGMLYVTGGTYDNYPIEKNVAYAQPKEGYKIVQNEDNTYGVVEKEAVKLFELRGANIKLGSDLTMFFYIPKAELESGVDYYATITKANVGEEATVVNVQMSEWENYSDDLYRVAFDDIMAYMMNDKIEVQIFDNDGTAVSDIWTDSISIYAHRIYANQNNKFKTALVDMLNYGAACQRYFGYDAENLANKDLTDEQKNMASVDPPLTDSRVKGDNYYGSSVTCDSTLILQFYFENINETMTAKITYTDAYNEEITETIDGSKFNKRTNTLTGVKVGLAAYDAQQLVKCEVYDGDTLVASAVDSVESYVARMASTDDVYATIMKFALSSKSALTQK